MSNASDFIIENGVLTKHVGPGGDVIIPEDVTEIGGSAFWHCGDLSDITIPNSVTKIGNCAFESCWRLTNSVIQIGEKAFDMCHHVTIHAPAGSYAEQYAKENNIPFVAE